MLSVVLPSYNEEKMIPIATGRLGKILGDAKIDYELLFVDDGSRDNTWKEIQRCSREDRHVVGVHFSRNFGKESAMFAGLEQSRGDCVVVMDCDLQHPPEKIVDMYRLWEQGYEVVEGIKEDRGEESAFHKFASNSFYSLISRATGMDMGASSDFKLLDRKVVDTLNALPERNVFFRALSFWVGFKKAEVLYRVQERTAAYRDGDGRDHADRGGGLRGHLPGAEDHGRRPARLHHRDSAAAAHRELSDDLPRHHRLLPRAHL